MAKKKSRHTCRKGAAHHGGGKRPLRVALEAPAQAASAASAPSSGSDSDDSALRLNAAPKATKLFADASPRASPRAWTPLASPRATTPQPTIVDIERALRNSQKLARQIEGLMLKPISTLNHDQQTKLSRYSEVALEVERLQAALAATVQTLEDSADDEGEAAGRAS